MNCPKKLMVHAIYNCLMPSHDLLLTCHDHSVHLPAYKNCSKPTPVLQWPTGAFDLGAIWALTCIAGHTAKTPPMALRSPGLFCHCCFSKYMMRLSHELSKVELLPLSWSPLLHFTGDLVFPHLMQFLWPWGRFERTCQAWQKIHLKQSV